MVNSEQSVSVNNEASNQDSSVSSSQSVTPVIENKPEVQEKVLKQSEVDKIVGSVKRDTLDKARREYESKLQQAQVQTQPASYAQSNQLNVGNNLPDDHIRRLINEEAQKQAQYTEANRVAHEFISKLEATKSKYPDFEEKVSQLNLPSIPQIVGIANSMDNTGDIMYEIATNPSKFASVMVLAHTAPHLAQAELRRLSESIKHNEAAAKQPSAAEPLSQVKPSTTGTDNGSSSVRDLRKQSWLRG